MFKNKRIGVIMGGLSEEREISIKSGRAVEKSLRALGYKVIAIDAGRDVASSIKKEKIEAAFIALHGKGGEDGAIQGMLELMGIPYTGSGVLASAIAMDKAVAKVFFRCHGIETPEFEVFKRGKRGFTKLPLPVIVKPLREGSTIGVSVVRDKGEFRRALLCAYEYGDTALIERFIQGRELTVSILNGRTLPIIEILTKEKIFNFKAKYTKGVTQFKAPAILTGKVEKSVNKAALTAYNALGCRGAARVDIMLDSSGTPSVLEVNTIPGMTELSLLPRSAAAKGIGYDRLAEEILFSAQIGGC